jgi:hypothetical protein
MVGLLAARGNAQAWREFEQAVGVVDSVPESSTQNPRKALHAYYDRLIRRAAARSWMKWEFLISVSHKLTQSTNTSDTNATMASIKAWNQTGNPPVVAVHTMRDSWSYRDASGAKISDEDRRRLGMPSALESIEGMRQGLRSDLARSEATSNEPREFQVVESAQEIPSGNMPAQNMLTCFYSTNDKFCVNNVDLLSPERVERLRGISCIAVQGGSDPYAPLIQL